MDVLLSFFVIFILFYFLILNSGVGDSVFLILLIILEHFCEGVSHMYLLVITFIP